MSRTVLWWGRFDPDYSRNRILRQCFADLGWRVLDFRPHLSMLADWQAALHRLPKVDLVWLPCFRQRDLAAARRWSRRHGLPLIADPLISAYDKQVFERGKFAAGSAQAERLRAWEGELLRSADLLIADTPAHAEFFAQTFAVAPNKIQVVHVGAEAALFQATPLPPYDGQRPLEALFFGSFIGLQGPETIVEAARCYQGPSVRWVLLGDGPLKAECQRRAQGLANVAFEPWLAYAQLPARIAQADIVLGVFGASDKAGRVIPNKVFQALACGRPVVTREGAGYPPELQSDGGIVRLPPADPAALAQAVAKLADQAATMSELGRQARVSYERYFGERVIADELAAALAAVTCQN